MYTMFFYDDVRRDSFRYNFRAFECGALPMGSELLPTRGEEGLIFVNGKFLLAKDLRREKKV